MTTFSTSGSHRHSVGSRARRSAARPDDRPSQIHVQAITLAHVLSQAVKLNSSSLPQRDLMATAHGSLLSMVATVGLRIFVSPRSST
jgi:hypothetical protein